MTEKLLTASLGNTRSSRRSHTSSLAGSVDRSVMCSSRLQASGSGIRHSPTFQRMEEGLPHTKGRGRKSGRTLRVSLRCWVLCPFVTILSSICIVSTVLALLPWTHASTTVIESLHDVVKVNYVTLSGWCPFTRMSRLANGIGSLYFSNNTFQNPLTDRLMPLGPDMVSTLCITLRDVDRRRMISVIGAFSLTRKKAVLCVSLEKTPGGYYGHESKDGKMQDLYYMDPVTMEYQHPLKRFESPTTGLSIEEYTKHFHFDTVIQLWNESVRRGRQLQARDYWVYPRFPPTYASYVYPFFEQGTHGTNGVGYIYVGMNTAKNSVRWHRASDSGVRVMLVDVHNDSGRFHIFANNWGQPLSNVSDEWMSTFRNEPVKFMSTTDVSDELMAAALKHIDLQEAIRGHNQRETFRYSGLMAVVSADHIVSESGVDMVVVVVTSPAYYHKHASIYWFSILVLGCLLYAFSVAAFVYFVEICLYRPIRSTEEALRGGLVKASQEEGPRIVALKEICELQGVCGVLRERINAVRTYIPDRVFDVSVEEEGVLRTRNSAVAFPDSTFSSRLHTEELRPVACSVAYVYYTAGRALNPTNTVVESMMQIVVNTASLFGGCFEVQRPDYCVLSFGIQSTSREFGVGAAQAVEFAREVSRKFMESSVVAGLYRVIVESGAFPSGIVSGGGRSRYILLCRNLHRCIGDVLQSADVTAAVTEETALLVRDKFQLLPFGLVFLEGKEDMRVTLYEVQLSDVGAHRWNEFERYYNEAYDMMVRGNYLSAARLLDKAIAIQGKFPYETLHTLGTSQPQRLREVCALRVKRSENTPFVLRVCVPVESVSSSPADTRFPSPTPSCTNSKGNDDPLMNDHELRGRPQPIAKEDNCCALNGELPHFLDDCYGNRWQRSINPIDEAAESAAVAYMGMSATGVLAVLRLYPLTERGASLTSEEMNTVLEKVLQAGESASLVQCLSYCRVPDHGVFLVWEYVPGGTLRDLKVRYGRKLPLATVRRHLTSILRGLVCLHRRGFVQGRLCLETVVTSVGGHCRLTEMLLDAAPFLKCQMTYCMSPEEAFGKPQTWMTDMYALGLLLLEMLNEDVPWQWTANALISRSRNELLAVLSDPEALRKSLREGLLEPVSPPDETDETILFVLSACLKTVPEERRDAVYLLQHLGGSVAHDI